jgi:hypothetical protein
MSEEDIIKDEKKLAEMEKNDLDKIIPLIGGVKTLCNHAVSLAKNGKMDESHINLLKIKQQLIEINQEQLKIIAAEAQIKADIDKFSQGRADETRNENTELVQDAEKKKLVEEIKTELGVLVKLLSAASTNGIYQDSGKTKGSITPEADSLLRQINNSMQKLIQLEKVTMDAEKKDEMIKGTRSKPLQDLIKNESTLTGILINLLGDIKKMIEENQNALSIVSYIKKAEAVANELIKCENLEIKEVTKEVTR